MATTQETLEIRSIVPNLPSTTSGRASPSMRDWGSVSKSAGKTTERCRA
jgi:hypothetical protein